jgi:hypothetical protein
MKKTREEKITESISTDGFTYKGVHYKSMTTRTLLLLEKYKSPFYYGGDQLKGLMDFLYIVSHDPKEVSKIPFEKWDEVIFDFADTLTAEDLKNLGEYAQNTNDVNSSTIVEVREEAKKK